MDAKLKISVFDNISDRTNYKRSEEFLECFDITENDFNKNPF